MEEDRSLLSHKLTQSLGVIEVYKLAISGNL